MEDRSSQRSQWKRFQTYQAFQTSSLRLSTRFCSNRIRDTSISTRKEYLRLGRPPSRLEKDTSETSHLLQGITVNSKAISTTTNSERRWSTKSTNMSTYLSRGRQSIERRLKNIRFSDATGSSCIKLTSMEGSQSASRV